MRSDPRWDSEILGLAVPAAATLAAEPAYLLTDTALVGTLGTEALASLAVANTIILAAYTIFIFLTFATTAAVARLLGAHRRRDAAEEGVTATWLGALLGAAVAVVVLPLAPSLVRLFGAEPEVAAGAVTYLRISSAGFPALLIVMAGAGFRRGHHDTRSPLYVGLGTAAINLVIEVVLLLVLDFGIGASALSTVAAQWVGALVYVALVAAEARRHGVGLTPHFGRIGAQLRVGSALIVRTVALRSIFLMAVAVAGRMGTVELAAYQVGIGIWTFLAFAYDGIETAGQALVARELGGDRAAAARSAAGRVLAWAVVASLVLGLATIAGHRLIAGRFSTDPAVVAAIAGALLWVGAGQPVAGPAFAYDGVLVGAGDLRFLAVAMLAVAATFAVGAALTVATGAGLWALWATLTVAMVVRTAVMSWRFRSGAWVRTGAAAAV
ncbi:MAG: MATE family efflux transporter [Microthrixaceae bacterium]